MYRPINLAYGKKAYNTDPESGNPFQSANAMPDRLTDGVQIDPATYENLNDIPADDYSALGKLNWIGTESSKKGNIVIDLGQAMNFNEIKLYAKSVRLKYANVWVTEDTTDHAGDWDNVAFTPVEPVHVDEKGEWSYFNADNNGGEDSADSIHTISLGKTYTSRYVRLYVENGSGQNKVNEDGTIRMTGPPRLSELEIYYAPEPPSGMKVEYDGGEEATVSWVASMSEYYQIYDRDERIADEIASSSHTFKDLDPGAVYSLTVKSCSETRIRSNRCCRRQAKP
ncbi:fibronectin type III domain-containing protein [Paenibacillus sp. J5C_2022]|uniref:fibronectin type III domain-containing protein n=1 Tax=Paenibacillus sp. J5C2022 TaxID=2977129 RepID=UPI0021D0864B|nr:fibronectin type III domain-containing protein [Paenibacillus sp. J5C2022]MCU6707441.1 fibronectin type III domain-containing protein [Paenibacillus sp. J5C2022]